MELKGSAHCFVVMIGGAFLSGFNPFREDKGIDNF